MPKYSVRLWRKVPQYFDVEVEAPDPETAKDLAMKTQDPAWQDGVPIETPESAEIEELAKVPEPGPVSRWRVTLFYRTVMRATLDLDGTEEQVRAEALRRAGAEDLPWESGDDAGPNEIESVEETGDDRGHGSAEGPA